MNDLHAEHDIPSRLPPTIASAGRASDNRRSVWIRQPLRSSTQGYRAGRSVCTASPSTPLAIHSHADESRFTDVRIVVEVYALQISANPIRMILQLFGCAGGFVTSLWAVHLLVVH